MLFKRNKNIKHKVGFNVFRGHNHLFKKYSRLVKYKDGNVELNGNKVKVISCEPYVETETTKSVGKKIAGATVGSLFGPGGTVVGAMVTGNNKKVKHKYNQLIVEDEEGQKYEALISNTFLLCESIQLMFIK